MTTVTFLLSKSAADYGSITACNERFYVRAASWMHGLLNSLSPPQAAMIAVAIAEGNHG